MTLIEKLLHKLEYNKKANVHSLKFSSKGEGVVLEKNLHFAFEENITLGDYVYLGQGTALYGRGGIDIGNYSIISSEVILLSSIHNYLEAELLPYDQKELVSPIVIGRCCWIGIRVIVLPGVMLEEGCIVGAGAVVTKSFAKGSIIAGNPAKLIKYRNLDQYEDLLLQQKYYMREKQKGNLKKISKVIPRKSFFQDSK